jgi:hypothetical protein
MRAVPDVVDLTTFGKVATADQEAPSRVVYDLIVATRTIAVGHHGCISLTQPRLSDKLCINLHTHAAGTVLDALNSTPPLPTAHHKLHSLHRRTKPPTLVKAAVSLLSATAQDHPIPTAIAPTRAGHHLLAKRYHTCFLTLDPKRSGLPSLRRAFVHPYGGPTLSRPQRRKHATRRSTRPCPLCSTVSPRHSSRPSSPSPPTTRS